MQARNLKEWHNQVCSRDGYICTVCKKDFSYSCYFLPDGRNAYVCGNHIRTQGSHPELKLETDNGECICLPCHNKHHNGELTKKL